MLKAANMLRNFFCATRRLIRKERRGARYHKQFDAPALLNVNVPDVPYDALQGVEVTRLGKRHKAEPVVKAVTPRNETVYWVGAAGQAQDAGEGTDFNAVRNNRVSVTPLQLDLTHNSQLPLLRNWLAL